MKTFYLALFTAFSLSLNAQVYLYGTTSKGGDNDKGVIFRTDAFGQNYQVVYHFNDAGGHTPIWGMTLAPNGKLYGFTSEGGSIVNQGATTPLGTMFEFDPVTFDYVVKKYIDDQTNFGTEFTRFIVNDNNELITASISGPLDTTTFSFTESRIFKYNPTNNQISIVSIIPAIHQGIHSPIIQGQNGDYYFNSKNGGANGFGSLGSYNESLDQFTTIYDLTGQVNGGCAYPSNNPVFEDTDGRLYLISAQGGATNSGAGLSILPDGSSYQYVIGFSTSTPNLGIKPAGTLKKYNNYVYFFNSELGQFNNGLIYKINLGDFTDNTVVHAFDTVGAKAESDFTESSNGKWYFVCNEGGDYNKGSIVQFDPVTENPIKRHSFNTSDGYSPRRSTLTLVDFNMLSVANKPWEDLNISIFPNPVSNYISIKNAGKNNIQEVRVYNSSGQLIYSSNTLNRINLTNFHSGIFFIQLTLDDNRIVSRKISKI